MKKILLICLVLFTVNFAYADNIKVIAKFIDGKLCGSQPIYESDLGHPTDESNAYNSAIRWVKDGAEIPEARSIQVFNKKDFNPDDFEQYEYPVKTEKDRFLEMLDDSDVKTKIKNIKP